MVRRLQALANVEYFVKNEALTHRHAVFMAKRSQGIQQPRRDGQIVLQRKELEGFAIVILLGEGLEVVDAVDKEVPLFRRDGKRFWWQQFQFRAFELIAKRRQAFV